MTSEATTKRIRELNDLLRKTLPGDAAVITPGIAALGPEVVQRIFKTVQVFDDFSQANDPYSEHDFGSFEAEGTHTVLFKIDYYDRSLRLHSPDPSDPLVTRRIITLMLAEEY